MARKVRTAFDPKAFLSTVDHGRTCVPSVSSRSVLEAVERINLSIYANPQDTRIVRPDKDHIAQDNQTC